MDNADDLFTICSVGVHVLVVPVPRKSIASLHRGYYYIGLIRLGVGIIEIEVCATCTLNIVPIYKVNLIHTHLYINIVEYLYILLYMFLLEVL